MMMKMRVTTARGSEKLFVGYEPRWNWYKTCSQKCEVFTGEGGESIALYSTALKPKIKNITK